MAPHSSTPAWKIPWMEEPGRLWSMGLLRVGHDWATSLSLFTFMHWRRKWQPTPVFLPGESRGRGSLVGCRLWDCRVGHNWSDLAAVAVAATDIRRLFAVCFLLLFSQNFSMLVSQWKIAEDGIGVGCDTKCGTVSLVWFWRYCCSKNTSQSVHPGLRLHR